MKKLIALTLLSLTGCFWEPRDLVVGDCVLYNAVIFKAVAIGEISYSLIDEQGRQTTTRNKARWNEIRVDCFDRFETKKGK